MEDFLKSKAMITPGIAGATTTLITGTLYSQFGLPAKWVGLVVSLLFGLSIWADKEVPIYQRIVFYVINSLTIFAVAIGINQAGMAVEMSSRQDKAPAVIERMVPPSESTSFFHNWLR
ncbi:MAG: hypothetical protein GY868_04455 [Deltaproteobacteria bacterium]|nr:hypothetical protein [Deltaproteobacteria bacterium]